MGIIEAFILALIQGITEFLPISSSGHLILGSQLLGWADQGLAFDVTVHLGSLVAVLIYFRQDISAMALAWFQSVHQRKIINEQARLAWSVLFATIPVGLAGLFLGDYVEQEFRSVSMVAATMLVFAPLLWVADKFGRRDRSEMSIGLRDILVVGVAQAFALLPGVSRSGITMLAGLGMGLSREASARFSFLLSIPVIVLVGAVKSLELWQNETAINGQALLVGFAVSAISAYLCIHFFLKFLERIGFKPFAFYLLILACFLLLVK